MVQTNYGASDGCHTAAAAFENNRFHSISQLKVVELHGIAGVVDGRANDNS